jgi:transposase
VRTLGLDVHKTFIEVALHEAGSVRRVGRVAIRDLSVFAESLAPTDHVVLESTSVAWAIVDVLAKRAGKVTVSNPMKTRAIASAKGQERQGRCACPGSARGGGLRCRGVGA